MKLKIKDQLPDKEIFQLVDGEPQKSKLRETIGNGKVVLFGLPGAFTSTCSKLHLPGFVANADKDKKTIIYCYKGISSRDAAQYFFDIGFIK